MHQRLQLFWGFCCQSFCSFVAVNIMLQGISLHFASFHEIYQWRHVSLHICAQKLVVCLIRHSIALQVLSLAVLALSSSNWNSSMFALFSPFFSLGVCSLQFWPTEIQGFPVTCCLFNVDSVADRTLEQARVSPWVSTALGQIYRC